MFGGCDPNANGVYNATCAQNAVNILTLPTSSSQTQAQWTTGADCPPGSYGATLAPNRNQATTIFNSQVFLFPGAVDDTRWNDQSGTQQGEVGILLASSGVWARVLPAPDPASMPGRPSFKEGAAVYSHSESVFGQGAWSDTLVFGGRDVATGQMTNELWILRAYNGTIQSSSDHWSGYGNGQLQSGVGASGAGVTVQFLPSCATPITSTGVSTTTTTSGPSQTSTGTNSPSTTALPGHLLYGSPVHKIISPLSIAFFLPAILLYRASSGPFTRPLSNSRSISLSAAAGFIAVAAYALGIVGFVLGVTQDGDRVHSSSSPLTRRDAADSTSTSLLSSPHGKAALVLFAVLYGILPIVAVLLYVTRPRKPSADRPPSRPSLQRDRKPTDETVPTAVGSGTREKSMANSEDDGLMMNSRSPNRTSIDSHGVIESDEGDEFPNRRRTKSISSGHMFDGLMASYKARRRSEATLSPPPTYPPPSNPPQSTSKFEVVNRPKRSSASALSHPPVSSSGQVASSIPRNPSDLDWLERRRSVNMYGQLDYQLNQASSQLLEVPHPNRSSAHEMSPTTPPVPARTPPGLPRRTAVLYSNIGLQVVILWALVFWIVTFAILPSTLGLALVAAAAALYYIGLVALAWTGYPRRSVLVVAVSRLRGDPTDAALANAPPSTPGGFSPVPTTSPGRPYIHSPLWRPAREDDVGSGARSMESEAEDDDEDDAARQARIEEEMARRDVSIFTVPKRRLVVRN